MKKRLWMAAICGLFLVAPAQGADLRMDEIVISASKFEDSASEQSSSISIVTAEDMENQQSKTLIDALQSVPGVFLSTQEGPAGMNGLSIRGAGTNYTQFRFNGFPLREAADTDSGFSSFYGALNLASGAIGRIEVLKGSQSTLYGSSAMAGVVSLYPAGSWDSGFRASLDLGGGSWGTARTSAQVSYGNETYYVNFTPVFVTSDGYRGLWYDQGGFTFGAGMRLSEKTALELSSLFSSFRNAAYDSPVYDAATGTWSKVQALDKDSYHNEGQFALVGLTLTHEVGKAWSVQGKAAVTSSDREYVGLWGTSEYLGQSTYLELINTLRPLENFTLVAGVEYEWQDMERQEEKVRIQNKSADETSAYAKAILSFLDRKLTLNAGGRFSKHVEFSSHATWELGLSYSFETETRVYGKAATGYRTPSLYQRYGGGAWYQGNPALRPETSLGFEAGLEQSFWEGRGLVGVSLFSTDFDEQLSAAYDGSSGKYVYENSDKARVRGFELGLSLQPNDMFRMDAGYTHVSSKQKTSGGIWMHGSQMPEDKWAATLSIFPVDKMTLSLTGRWEGRRRIKVGGIFVEESPFFTMDLAGTYELSDHVQLYARVCNLLDEEYAVHGWEMPGIHALAGIRVAF